MSLDACLVSAEEGGKSFHDDFSLPVKTRSRSNQNLAVHSDFPFMAHPHITSGTQAPTTTQLQVSMPSNSLSTGRPKLMPQLSQASSCMADSPSPVERDGGWSTSSNKSDISLVHSTKTLLKHKSLDLQETDSGEREQFCAGGKTSPDKLAHINRKGEHYLSTSVHNKAPSHSHSNPEFPLLAHIRIDETDRAHSSDNIFRKRKQPPYHALAVSLSRERINSLTSQIYSSLDQSWTTSLPPSSSGSYEHLLKHTGGSNVGTGPLSEIIQKIISIATPYPSINREEIRTLMESSTACNQTSGHLDLRSKSAHSSLIIASDCEEEPVYRSPVTYLRSMGYMLASTKPLTIKFGVPCEGYMTLTSKLISDNHQKKDILLKVSCLFVLPFLV